MKGRSLLIGAGPVRWTLFLAGTTLFSVQAVAVWAHLLGWSGDPSAFLLRFPLGILVPIQIALSGIFASVFVELFRAVASSGADWSNKKHVGICIVTWLILAVIQALGLACWYWQFDKLGHGP
jgi:hypothetical protein